MTEGQLTALSFTAPVIFKSPNPWLPHGRKKKLFSKGKAPSAEPPTAPVCWQLSQSPLKHLSRTPAITAQAHNALGDINAIFQVPAT